MGEARAVVAIVLNAAMRATSYVATRRVVITGHACAREAEKQVVGTHPPMLYSNAHALVRYNERETERYRGDRLMRTICRERISGGPCRIGAFAKICANRQAAARRRICRRRGMVVCALREWR